MVSPLAQTNQTAANAALSKNASAETKAMMNSARAGKDLEDNFGHKTGGKEKDRESRWVAKSTVGASGARPLTKTRPSDGDDGNTTKQETMPVANDNKNPLGTAPKQTLDPYAGIAQKASNDNQSNIQNGRFQATSQAGFQSPGEKNKFTAPELKNADEKQRAAQQASLEVDTPQNLELGEAKAGLSKRMIADLEGRGRLGKPANDNIPISDRVEDSGEREIQDEKINDQSFNDINLQIPEEDGGLEEKYDRTLKALASAGYPKISRADIDTFRRSYFKVALPKGYIIISLLAFFTSTIFLSISVLMFIVGLGTKALGLVSGFFTFGLGTLGTLIAGWAGSSITIVGLGLTVMSIISSITLSIASVISSIYYLKTASVVLRHTKVLEKYAFRLMVIRIILICFAWVPLLNLVIFAFGGRSFWRMAKRESHKVAVIIRDNFK